MKYVNRLGIVGLMACTAVFYGCNSSEFGESTKIGAVSGGAVGAGLGAIIGSQTGDAGGGLLIGGLAGAGAGAAVGNALDERDMAIATQDQALERQEKIIESQKNQIEELRRLSQDNVKFRADAGGASAFQPSSAPIQSRNIISSRSLIPNNQRETSGSERFVEPRQVPTAQSFQQPLPTSSFAEERVESAVAESPDIRAAFQETSLEEQKGSYAGSSQIITENDQPSLGDDSSESEEMVNRFNSVDCRNALTEHSIGTEAAEVADKLFRFRRALRLCPENPLFHVELGRTYVTMGRTDDARYEFEEALRLDSGYETARKELAFLDNRF